MLVARETSLLASLRANSAPALGKPIARSLPTSLGTWFGSLLAPATGPRFDLGVTKGPGLTTWLGLTTGAGLSPWTGLDWGITQGPVLIPLPGGTTEIELTGCAN